jgi:hypothetical protein
MKPIVRIIQSQEENTQPANIDSWEAEQLLRKYGHQPQQFSTHQEPQKPVDNGLTFEQMVAQEESRLKEEEMRRHQRMHGPRPTTFDGRNGYDSEVKYTSDDDTGFGFKIEITTDMKIPRY